MAGFRPPSGPGETELPESSPGSPASPEASGESPPITPLSYRRFDRYSQRLILFMVVFSPWAFGTTQPWAIWLMNLCGYALGVLLLAKRLVRWRTGYRPPRWGEEVPKPGVPARFRPHTRKARWLTRGLAAGTVLFLGYTLVSALNYRSYFDAGVQHLNDRFIPWLPHTYTARATWATFWMYLGLAGTFWALRDWLLGKTPFESGEEEETFTRFLGAQRAGLPERLSRLLWVLCLNGTLLGVVAILQRLEGTDKLLWLVKPRFGGPDFHFGPFVYRGNGAQFFNLLWPLALAFWWTLFRASRTSERAPTRAGDNPHLVLLPCVLILLACPIITASRGGAVITLVQGIAALGILIAVNWRAPAGVRLAMLTPFVLALGLVGYLGWNQYRAGLTQAFADDLGDRVEIHKNARVIAADYPWFGTGPGSFATLYQMYLESADADDRAAYAHNDWLQTRITYGRLGLALVLLMLAHTFLRWWFHDGIPAGWDLVAMIWLAMAGCLFHARFDFPFQVYSLLLLFLTLCGISVCLGRKS